MVTCFPQDYITVTLPSLKFGPPVPLLQSSGVLYTILNLDISSPRILCEINVWILYYTMTHARTMKQIFLFWLSKVSTTLRFCLISEFQGALAWMTRHHITRFDTCELVRDPCLSFSSILSFLPQKTQAKNVWDQGTSQSSIWRSNQYPSLWRNRRIAVSESSFPLSVTEHGTKYLRGASKQSLWSLRKWFDDFLSTELRYLFYYSPTYTGFHPWICNAREKALSGFDMQIFWR